MKILYLCLHIFVLFEFSFNENFVVDAKKKEEQLDEMPGFSQFLYFLFAPTLIYRDNYPM